MRSEVMNNERMYAYWCMQLIEGDTYMVDDIFEQLRKDGYTDEDDEWICEEDED